jgi:hypothetical protein
MSKPGLSRREREVGEGRSFMLVAWIASGELHHAPKAVGTDCQSSAYPINVRDANLY